jgi:predicted transcriptional regulator
MKGRMRNLGTIDLDTGEILEGKSIYCPPKQRSLFSTEGYVAMSQEAMKMIANSQLDGVAMRVLFRIGAELDMDNFLNLNQAQIAEEMGIKTSNFSRAIKDLIKEGILIEGSKIGRTKTYRFNPNYGWKGSTKNHVIALEEHMKKRMKNAGISGVIENKNISVTVTINEYEAAERAGQQRLFGDDMLTT